MSTTWSELTCEAPAGAAEIIADHLATASGNGVCIENIMTDAFSHDEIEHPETVTVKAYFSPDVRLEDILTDLRALLARLAEQNPSAALPEPVVRTVGSEDWSSSWKENFKPIRIGTRLLVAPSWEPLPDRAAEIVLRIDPGMAFGTGGHETTRLCLEMLEEAFEQPAAVSAPSVLDLGTGSGILAMAAALLGAGSVTAVDIDPQAVDVARENIAQNGLVGRIACSTTPLEALAGPFDIIVANILAEELVRLSPLLTGRLAPGGRLILSGILAEKEQLVLDGFAPRAGLRHLGTATMGEWVAMLYGHEER